MAPIQPALTVAIGHSHDVDPELAISKAIEACELELDGVDPAGGMLLASVDYDHAPMLERVQARWPGIEIIGGTTDGELSDVGGFQPDSVLLVLFAGRGLRAVASLGENLSADVGKAVVAAVDGLPDEKPALILTSFAPSTNASEVLRELDATLGSRRAPVVGGLTGDHREFAHMQEFFGRRVLADSLPILALYGEFKASWGVSSGWKPMGDEHRVTRSDGNVVHEIDGLPAIEVYRRYYAGFTTDGLAEFPLALYPTPDSADVLMRAVLNVDEETGALTFAGEMPEGASVRMTNVLVEGILDGTRRSLEQALEQYSGSDPSFAMLFTCAARQWVLGGKAEEELEVVRAALPSGGSKSIGVAGFYCFGEILPSADGPSLLHNDSCVSLLLGE